LCGSKPSFLLMATIACYRVSRNSSVPCSNKPIVLQVRFRLVENVGNDGLSIRIGLVLFKAMALGFAMDSMYLLPIRAPLQKRLSWHRLVTGGDNQCTRGQAITKG
jgi:hypothetical protein